MADFPLTGTVVRDAADPDTVALQLDLAYRVQISVGVLGITRRFPVVSVRGVMQSDRSGAFNAIVTIADDLLAQIDQLPRVVDPRIDVTVLPFLPPANRRNAVVRRSLAGNLTTQLSAALRNLRVTVNLDPQILVKLNLTALLEDDVDELENVNQLSLELLQQLSATPGGTVTAGGLAIAGQGSFRIGSGVARRDGDSYVGTVVCRRDELRSFPSWVVMHDRTPRPADNRVLENTSLGRIFIRTRAVTFDDLNSFDTNGDGRAIDSNILLTRFQETIRQDDTQDDLVDLGRIEQDVGFGLLLAEVSNVDFRDADQVRVTGRIGYGVSLPIISPFPGQLPGLETVQLFEIGKFSVTLSIARFTGRRLLPSRNRDFTTPLNIEVFSTSFDLLPGTDLDELPGAPRLSIFEDFIAGVVAERILERFAERVADRVDDRIDDLFDERRDQLDAAASLQGITRAQLIAELREHLYLQMDDAAIESNDLNLVGFAGLWHPLVGSDAENIDCAASAAAFMFPATAPLKMFRRYERALAHEHLAPWNEAYRTHRKELARIAITDASLTGTVVRLAADLLPMLGEKSKATLSADAVQRLTKILAITRAQASPKLAPFLDRASEVFTAGEGKAFGELLKIAAQRAPK